MGKWVFGKGEMELLWVVEISYNFFLGFIEGLRLKDFYLLFEKIRIRFGCNSGISCVIICLIIFIKIGFRGYVFNY